jgi:hypothetical protein
MREHWPSTKGLSVHNVLRTAHREMTPAEITAFLQRAFDPRVDAEYVETGIKFLLERGFATLVGPLVVANRAYGELVRIDGDRELVPSRPLRPRQPRPPWVTALDAGLKDKG